MRIAVYSAMHGRQGTVKKCLDYLHLIKEEVAPWVELDFIYGYSWTKDGDFLKQWPEVKTFQVANAPLWAKFHGGMDILKEGNYDACIMIGSDDIFDNHYIDTIYLYLAKYDYIGFRDIYFHNLEDSQNWYWGGYKGRREGEPAGAGKVYSRAALEALDYKIFQPSIDRGLDKGCHDRIMSLGLPSIFPRLWTTGAFLCDVKDGHGLTSLSKFPHLSKVGKEFFSFE